MTFLMNLLITQPLSLGAVKLFAPCPLLVPVSVRDMVHGIHVHASVVYLVRANSAGTSAASVIIIQTQL